MAQVLIGRRPFLALGAAPFTRARAATDAPNVLLIICDQMRADALGCLGNPNAHTPNLDRLASEGVLFERCTAANPVCVPSRKSLFTGLFPHRHGSLTNDHDKFLTLEGTLPGYFRSRGYKTGYFGKNHAFRTDAIEQLDAVAERTREKFRAYTPNVTPWWHAAVPWPETECYPHRNTEDALRFLAGVKPGERFFATVSYFDPHPPYFAPPRHLAKIDAASVALPRASAPGALSPRLEQFSRAMGYEKMTAAEIRETIRHYHAAVDWGVDEQVGRIMAALRASRHADSTVVIFVSDHGDFMGNYHMVRKGMFLYEALLHVPMIWWSPGRIAAGLRTAAPVQLVDLFPTLVELTGGKPPANTGGVSAKPLLAGAREGIRKTVYASAGYGEIDLAEIQRGEGKDALHSRVFSQHLQATHKTAMIREGDWKLILNETGTPELYRLAGSAHETRNVVEEKANAGRRRELENKLRRWWAW